jgi:hypothetical protein
MAGHIIALACAIRRTYDDLHVEWLITLENAVFRDVTPCASSRTDVSEEDIASIIRVERINELGKTLAVTG